MLIFTYRIVLVNFLWFCNLKMIFIYKYNLAFCCNHITFSSLILFALSCLSRELLWLLCLKLWDQVKRIYIPLPDEAVRRLLLRHKLKGQAFSLPSENMSLNFCGFLVFSRWMINSAGLFALSVFTTLIGFSG